MMAHRRLEWAWKLGIHARKVALELETVDYPHDFHGFMMFQSRFHSFRVVHEALEPGARPKSHVERQRAWSHPRRGHSKAFGATSLPGRTRRAPRSQAPLPEREPLSYLYIHDIHVYTMYILFLSLNPKPRR